ncbi:hypothetical protein L7F22_023930 [Adiantum nelumboides]|nr:hypothetical protein [Adiantum nelumboides]
MQMGRARQHMQASNQGDAHERGNTCLSYDIMYGFAWSMGIGNKACARRIPHEEVGHIEELEDVGMEVHLKEENVTVNSSTIADSSTLPLKYMFEEFMGLARISKELIKEASDGIKRTLTHIKYIKAEGFG